MKLEQRAPIPPHQFLLLLTSYVRMVYLGLGAVYTLDLFCNVCCLSCSAAILYDIFFLVFQHFVMRI